MLDRLTLTFFHGAIVLAGGALVGLAAYLIIASVAGWIQPVWWGGEALVAPLLSGLALIFIGTVPFYGLARKVIVGFLGTTPLLGTTFLLGIVLGVSLIPIADALGFALRRIPPWQLLDPWIAVLLVMIVAGLIGTLLG